MAKVRSCFGIVKSDIRPALADTIIEPIRTFASTVAALDAKLASAHLPWQIIDMCLALDHLDTMIYPPETQVNVRRMGREGEPLVVIDHFSGIADQLLQAGISAQYQHAGASYPGIRCWADPSYLDRQRTLMMQVMQQVFGFAKGVRLDASTFSIVTLGEDELSPLQRIPHYDHAGGEVIAVMHYLQGPESGGTAFYRHRRTGFETVTPVREAAYNSALAEDERAHGMPPKRYCHGDTDWFEMIDEVQAQPDRLILYRGRQLHSGVIPDPTTLSSDPKKGRLTINMFLIGA